MIYSVTIERRNVKKIQLFLELPNEEHINNATGKELKELLQFINPDRGDWWVEDETIRVDNVYKHAKLRRIGGERLSGYVIDGKLVKKSEFAEAMHRFKSKPLPGQMGIPGVGNDIPK